jgi:2-polyprenyl-3-methyl-5-hydroxy-6-metoxy-1,4-benzoquinol methylase
VSIKNLSAHTTYLVPEYHYMKISSEKIYSNKGNMEVLSLVPLGKHVILDIGCGAGDNAKQLIEKGNIVDGITISDTEKEAVKNIVRNVWVHNAEQGLPGNMSELYDIVILSHVLEHICYPQKLLSDLKRSLSKDGKIIVALPNIMHYQSRLKLIEGNFDYQEAGVWDYTHFRWYTFKTAKELFKHNGYEIEFADVSGELPFGRITKKIFSRKIQQFLFAVLKGISKGFFGNQILVVARPIVNTHID